jgi:hypothetical protein
MKFRKHRLLIYERVHRQRRGLFLLAALALFLVYAAIAWPLIDEATLNSLWLWPPEYDILLLVFGVVFFLAFLYKLIAPRLTYVQCTERNVRIQTPLFPLFISYRRVTATRPNQWGRVYPPEKRTRRQRRLLEPISGAEVIVLDLKGWPMPLRWLKLWIPDVMFSPDGDGLVLWVKDWMALNRAFSDIKDRRREEQIGPRAEASLYSRVKR